jgi:nitroreductase
MEKPAEVQFPIHDLLRRRWSPLAFSSRLVEPWKLQSLFEAARWAPSSFNEQPWSYLFATRDNPAEFDQMVSCLSEGNVPWASTAPLLMLSVAKRVFQRNGNPNRHAFHDVGASISNLIVQATTLGLFVHQMAGFDPEKARQLFAIPEDHEAVAAIAIGYPGPVDALPEALQTRQRAPRTRKPLTEMVFSGKWGQAAPLIAPPA